MRTLNLGCGAKISRDPDVVNIDWSFFLRAKNSVVPMFLREVVRVLKPGGASLQPPMRRKRGETQRWMYDRAPFLSMEARKPALQTGAAQ